MRYVSCDRALGVMGPLAVFLPPVNLSFIQLKRQERWELSQERDVA